MAAPILSHQFMKQADRARNTSAGGGDLLLSDVEVLALYACFAEELGPLPSKATFSTRNKNIILKSLKEVDATAMIDLLRRACPKIESLASIASSHTLEDVNNDHFFTTIVHINEAVNALEPADLNWEKDRLCIKANYVALLLYCFYRLAGQTLQLWYNRIMQLAAFLASGYADIPMQFILPVLTIHYEVKCEENIASVRSNYTEAYVLLNTFRSSKEIEAIVNVLWGKRAMVKKDLQKLCEYPSLLEALANACANLAGGFSSGKKRQADEDPEYVPPVSKNRKVSNTSIVLINHEPKTGPTPVIPKIYSTNRIKDIQSFMTEPVYSKTVYTEATVVARMVVSANRLAMKDPLGLMTLIKDKHATHFVNVPLIISKFYKPYFADDRLDRNTYFALFLGWFPVWLVITSVDVVVYMLPVETFLADASLFDPALKQFNTSRLQNFQPDFNTCDVFQQKAFGVDLLPTLIGRVAVTMCILHGKQDIDLVELPDDQIPSFQAGAIRVMRTIFSITESCIKAADADVFLPLKTVCNVGKAAENHISSLQLKALFQSLVAELATEKQVVGLVTM